MSKWTSSPDKAWVDYILPHVSNPRWVEDSSPISEHIGLSKRELFALIIFAHLKSTDNDRWLVGYDKFDEEPNDGFIANKFLKIRVEHKVVPQLETRDVEKAILDTYKKYAEKGSEYGRGRVLVIQPNKASDQGGLVKISDLTDIIDEKCPFNKVLTLYVVARKGERDRTAVVQIMQYFPPIKSGGSEAAKGISQVDFDLFTGMAAVTHNGIEQL